MNDNLCQWKKQQNKSGSTKSRKKTNYPSSSSAPTAPLVAGSSMVNVIKGSAGQGQVGSLLSLSFVIFISRKTLKCHEHESYCFCESSSWKYIVFPWWYITFIHDDWPLNCVTRKMCSNWTKYDITFIMYNDWLPPLNWPLVSDQENVLKLSQVCSTCQSSSVPWGFGSIMVCYNTLNNWSKKVIVRIV